MYTAERNFDVNGRSNGWAILDPQGDMICRVESEWTAYALLSHLNRS